MNRQVFTNSSSARYYDREFIWSELSDNEIIRINDTLKLIPKDIESILNIGCGDGRVTRPLVEKYNIIGVDISHTAAKLCQGNVILASITSLPFKDMSFDLVLATEVLEHIDDQLFIVACNELQRVAAKYVLITVPNNEVLEENFIKCAKCHNIYHAWDHKRSFSSRDLKNLFSKFRVLSINRIGFLIPIVYRFLFIIMHNFGNTWSSSEKALCPHCLSTIQHEHEVNFIGWIAKRAYWFIYSHTPFKKKAFLAVLYRRKVD